MDFRESSQLSAFRAKVGSFLEDDLPAYFRRRREGMDEWAAAQLVGGDWGDPEWDAAWRAWQQQIAAMGWTAPGWSKEFGGAGLSVLEQFVLHDEFANAGVPHPGGLGVTLLGPTIIQHGTDEQRSEHLGRILTGDTFWCQAFSEPNAGSDLASVETTAVADGDDYVLNGLKTWVGLAHVSNWMFTIARTNPDAPKHRGISYFVLPTDSPGVDVRPMPQITGDDHFAQVSFQNVRVPQRNRVGEEGRGWYVATTTLDFERSLIGESVVVRKQVTNLAALARVSGALTRSASLRRELAELAIEAEVARVLSMRVAALQANGEVPNHEASEVKLFVGELQQRVARTGMKVGGLFGQIASRDTPYQAARRGSLQYSYLWSLATTIGGGTSEIQRNIIAQRGLALPRG